ALLRLVRALAAVGLGGAHVEPDDVVVRLEAEDGLVELDRAAGLGAVAGVNGGFHGVCRVFVLRNGVGVCPSAIRITNYAVRISSRPFFGPGTAPLISSRCWSAMTRTTRRFFTVTRSLPVCPCIRIPLKTRLG